MGAHLGVQIGDLNQWLGCSSTGDDDFHALRSCRESLHHVIDVEQPEIEHRVQLVKNHNGVKRAGDGTAGDIPPSLGFLLVEFGCLIGVEVVSATCSDLIDEVRKSLLKCLDGGIFVVGTAWAFQETQKQDPGSALFADPEPDGAQNHA